MSVAISLEFMHMIATTLTQSNQFACGCLFPNKATKAEVFVINKSQNLPMQRARLVLNKNAQFNFSQDLTFCAESDP